VYEFLHVVAVEAAEPLVTSLLDGIDHGDLFGSLLKLQAGLKSPVCR
jgi:hypothetical protein